MAIRKAGAPNVPGAVTALLRAAAEKAEPPSLVPAGTPPALQQGGTSGGSGAGGLPIAIKVAVVLPHSMHDDGELARHGHGSPTQADPRHQPAFPAS